MSTSIERHPDPWTFDPSRFARILSDTRLRLGWSTRELARRAALSQPYIVALERARSAEVAGGPTPTVDVVARLARALGLDAVALFTAGLRPAGQHVFMVVDKSSPKTVDVARSASGADTSQWIAIGSPAGATPTRGAAHHAIELRRTVDGVYRPHTVAASLADELRDLGDAIDGCDVGLVFTDTSKVMASLADPDTIMRFEHRWASVVDQAASAAHARAGWNVCVYEIGALRALADPVATTLDLMKSHDTTWVTQRSHVTTGIEAAQRVLERLRPVGSNPAEWRATARELATGIGLAA